MMRRDRSPSSIGSQFCPDSKRIKTMSSKNTTVTSDQTTIDQNSTMIPRSYQSDIVAEAKERNLIVCLPTGSGKTYIAVMLIKEMAASTRRSIHDGGKRTVFLVRTVALVQQQSDYIRAHTDLVVGRYYGELGVDLWNREQWIREFENHQVLVFTAQVFLDLVDHGHFPLYKVNLLVFDECHHYSGQNSYAALMERHYRNCHDKPRILGLTASISAKKINSNQLRTAAKEIETVFDAQLTSGSTREESNQYGTCAQFEPILCPTYRTKVFESYDSITIPFDIMQSILNDLENYLKKKQIKKQQIENELIELIRSTDYVGADVTDYSARSIDYTIFLQSLDVDLPRLKRCLNDLQYTGYELGIFGLFIAAEQLQKGLKSSRALEIIDDAQGKELFQNSLARIDCLVDDILYPLVEIHRNLPEILYSAKVLRLFERMKRGFDRDPRSLCIIFVERVYTAAVLSTLLAQLSRHELPGDQNHFKIKYMTGAKASVGDESMTAKKQRQIIRDFRSGDINVLVATAVVEEGLDVPKCNLVFRFNKPPNFSSYMQSKGRARAKQNAAYVLLIDEIDTGKDLSEYRNYEELEKTIQSQFSIDDGVDLDLEESNQLEPYRTETGVVIDATRAARIIHQYCAVIGTGCLCPPRILTRSQNDGSICILSMPANCPVRDDIQCIHRSKKLAKFKCYLEMVKLLHQRNELDEYCLPRPRRLMIDRSETVERQLFRLCDQLFEEKSDGSTETVRKQILLLPDPTASISNTWYLYRIHMPSEKDQLGFLAPVELPPLPHFNLYASAETILTIHVEFIKAIDYTHYHSTLERFTRYLFEHVIQGIIDSSNPILKFDLNQSPFKLLPCLLKNSNEIDEERMQAICSRLNKPLESHAHLSDEELYIVHHHSYRLLYTTVPDQSLLKRTSDLWPHKSSSEAIRTYADHFQSIVPNVPIAKDAVMATLRGRSRPRINYLYEKSLSKKEKKMQTVNPQILYFPIELLRYAPANRSELNLFYQVPSLLVRISQLYWVEQLRPLFATNISSYRLMQVEQMQEPVRFRDFLKTVELFTQNGRSFLPLTSLTYQSFAQNSDSIHDQPLPDLLLQSLTRRSSAEEMDHENLEVLGDCFLKLVVSMCLYYRHGLASAGVLSTEKIKQISNQNLYRLAVLKGLKHYPYAQKIDFRGELGNWLPPGYTAEAHERYTHQKMKRKAISDMIEAFIGAYLVSSDYATTMKFMQWLGLDVIPCDQRGQLIELPSILRVQHDQNHVNAIIQRFIDDKGLIEVEKTINYVFRDKAYLIAALTHPSNFANRITDCYERLEFLGDAVLDFLVTRYAFIHHKENLTPGRMTDIREDLSNNSRLAYILVASGLQRYILHNSTALFGLITAYAADEDLFPREQSLEQYLSRDLDQWPATNAPKALADVFEALVGAIFLDSGNSLQIVWQTIEPFLRSYMDQSMRHPTLNPIRSFKENGGEVIEDMVDDIADQMTKICRVQMPNGPIVEGRGTNKRMARMEACRKAMKDYRDHH